MDACPALFTRVTPPEAAMLAERLPVAVATKAPLGAALAGQHPDVQVLAVMVHDRVDPEVIDLFPRLRAVVTRSDGYDHLPLEHLRERDVSAYHVGDYATEAVSLLAFTMVLSLLRRVPEAVASTRGARAQPSWRRDHLMGRDLSEVKVGVLGTGRIGSQVARLVVAAGGRVVAHDLVRSPELAGLERVTYTSLDELLAAADVLTVHVPLTDETRALLDGRALDRMRRGSRIVNTARGAIIDHDALVERLESGHIAAYAADVLPGEPRPPDLPRLAAMDNVLCTPHLGAHTRATHAKRWERTLRIVEAVIDRREDKVATLRVT